MRRRTFFMGLGGTAAAVAFDARFIEPEWLAIRHINCVHPAWTFPHAIRLAHVSDFHASDDVRPELIETAIDTVLRHAPDLVCVTGDFVTNSRGWDRRWFSGQLRRLAADAPAYACLGNHDGGMFRRRGFQAAGEIASLITGSGMRLLHNRSEELRFDGGTIRLAGLGDLWAEELDTAGAFDGIDGREPTVLLAHNPDSKDFAVNRPWHLMLSGHTHGGQIRLPGIGAPFLPVRDKRFVAGLYEWNQRLLHISAGVGNAHGIRLNCRPEVSLLTLNSPVAAQREES